MTLGNLHDREENNLKTLFDFADGSIKLKNYRDRDHFISSCPFTVSSEGLVIDVRTDGVSGVMRDMMAPRKKVAAE